MKNFLISIFLVSLIFPVILCGALPAAQETDSLQNLEGATAHGIKMPIYHNETLQFLIFADKLTMPGQMLHAETPVLDLVRKGVSVNDITYQNKAELYPRNASHDRILKFWSERLHSDGLIHSPDAEIDRINRTASGQQKVNFRSAFADIDGKGFVAEYEKRIVRILDDVKIVVRERSAFDELENPDNDGKKPLLSSLNGTSDSMLLDFENNIIELTGNVKVSDPLQGNITCNRMVVTLGGEEREDSDGEGLMSSGQVRKVECFGNIRIERGVTPKGDEQTQFAIGDYASYDPVDGMLRLSGTQPLMRSGDNIICGKSIVLSNTTGDVKIDGDVHMSLFLPRNGIGGSPENNEQMTDIYSDTVTLERSKNLATLAGNVRVDDPQMKLECLKMLLHLKETPGSSGKPLTGTPSGFGDSFGEKITVEEIECFENVNLERKQSLEELAANGMQTAHGNYAKYLVDAGEMLLSGGEPVVRRGTDTLGGRTIRFNMNDNRLRLTEDCRLIMSSPSRTGNSGKSVVVSDSMDLNFGNNIGVFAGNVKIHDELFDVACDKMTIHLTDTAEQEEMKPAGLLSGIEGGGSKSVQEVVCTGDVTVLRKNPDGEVPETAKAGKAVYRYKEGKIILSENRPIIVRGRDSISGREVAIMLDEERLIVDEDSRIILESLRAEAGAEKPGQTVIESDYTDLDFGNNVLSFAGTVKVADPQLNLKSDEVKIYLLPAEEDKKAAELNAKNPLANPSSKSIERIVCSGRVHASDPKADLFCDELLLKFKPQAGSDATAIDEIICDRNVRMISRQAAEGTEDKERLTGGLFSSNGAVTLLSDNAVINLDANQVDFNGNVKVNDQDGNTVTGGKLTIRSDNVADAAPEKTVIDTSSEEYDPWAVQETFTPQQVSIGEGKVLREIVIKDNVEIRRDNLFATGDQAHYNVEDRLVTLTGEGKNRPFLSDGKNAQRGSKVLLNTATGTTRVIDPELVQIDKELKLEI